jgi:hypothetical protein
MKVWRVTGKGAGLIVSKAAAVSIISIIMLHSWPLLAWAKWSGVNIRSMSTMTMADGRPLLLFGAWNEDNNGLAYKLVTASPKAYPPASPQDWSLSDIRPGLNVAFSDEEPMDCWFATSRINGVPTCIFKSTQTQPGKPNVQLYGDTLASARNVKPQLPQDWAVAFPVFDPDWYSERLALASLEGRPLVASLGFLGSGNTARDFGIRIAWADTPAPENPSQLHVSDAVAFADNSVLNSAFSLSLSMADSLPVLAYATPGVTLAIPRSLPALNQPWDQIVLRAERATSVGLYIHDGDAYLLSAEEDQLLCGQCPVSGIKDAAQWRWTLVDDALGFWEFSAAFIGGQLGVVYWRDGATEDTSGISFALAETGALRGPESWRFSRVTDYGRFLALAEVDGKPAVGFLSPYAVCYAYATCPVPLSSKDWRVTTVYENQAFTLEKLKYDVNNAMPTASPEPDHAWEKALIGICLAVLVGLLLLRLRRRRRTG